ncbi:vitelline membrane outer layer protein 1-like [Pelobates fuscus]|uniref:vitelline membrane outer layer protein 1-like n=1 Tax=Pelobates fuscus TaxID=191477 RepID=UPI002FE4B93D
MSLTVSSIVLLSLFSLVTSDYGDYTVISVSNGGSWGNWGRIEWCPEGYVAKGFALKAESIQGKGDDTAVNGITLHCIPRYKSYPEKTISSSQGPWGSWTSPFYCLNGHLVSFSLKVEPPQGKGDDTTVNNIKFRCSDGRQLEGVGLPWGTYKDWSSSCNHGICGILTKVEGEQGKGDDTALNDIQMFCCSNVHSNKN